MKRLLFIISLLLNCLFSLWAQIPENSYWEDGENFLQVSYRADTIDFFGGSGHDGGFDIHLLPGDRPNRYVDVGYPDNAADSIVLLKMSEGDSTRNVLVFYSNGRPNDVLKQYFPESNEDWAPGLKQILERQLHQQFEGIYANHKMGISCRFTPGMILWSEGGLRYDTLHYVLNYEFDTPCLSITLSNGKTWWVNPTITGINIYNTTYWEEVDGYTQGDTLLFPLEKIWSTTEHQGRWPYTSSEVLTSGRIDFYPNEVLRLMRNEIYARHGYHFADTALQQFFYNQVWYQEAPDNSLVRLTPLEAFNVKFIQSLEHREKRYSTPIDEGIAIKQRPMASSTKEYAWTGTLDGNIPIDIRLEIRNDHVAAGYIRYLNKPSASAILLGGRDDMRDSKHKPIISLSELLENGEVGAFIDIHLLSDGKANGVWHKYGTGEKYSFILNKPYSSNASNALAPVRPDEKILNYQKLDREINIVLDDNGFAQYELIGWDYDIDGIAPVKNGQFRIVNPECNTSVQVYIFQNFVQLQPLSYPQVWLEGMCPFFGSVYIRQR